MYVLVSKTQKQTKLLVKQGTKQFMAVEVRSMDCQFQPQRLAPYRLRWSRNPLHDVESTWWITVWILYYFTEIEFGEQSCFPLLTSGSATIFSPLQHQIGISGKTTGKDQACWRMALLDFYTEQQLDLKHRGHELFGYDKVITDASGRIGDIRSALINPPVEAPLIL